MTETAQDRKHVASPAGPESADAGRSAPSGALARVVQVERGRVLRLTLLLALSFSLLLALALGAYYRIESDNRAALLMAARERSLHLAALTLTDAMAGVLAELRYFARYEALAPYLETDSETARQAIAREYAAFMSEKRHYDQLRFIDPDYRERIRVNHAPGGARIVPPAQLQSKAGRYYMQAMAGLGRGEIYVSPMDLNIENGRIEVPYKPVIRVGMAVFDGQGQRRGYVLINVLGENLLRGVRRLAGERPSIWMVDERGEWLLGPTPADAWSGLLPDRDLPAFAQRHPRAWAAMRQRMSGVATSADLGLSFLRVFPLQPAEWQGDGGDPGLPGTDGAYDWTLIAPIFPDDLTVANANLLRDTLVGGAFASLLATVLSAYLAYAVARARAHSQALERAVDNVPMMVGYVDAGQRYRFNNLAYQRNLGYSPLELYGRLMRDVLGEPVYRQLEPHIGQALRGRRVEFEMQVEVPGSEVRDMAVAYIPDLGERGEVRGFYTVVNDVTPLKRAQRRERQHLQELAHVSRLASMGEIATELAHQINQPLSAIGMFSSAAARHLERGGEQARVLEWLEMIKAQVQRASDVVQRLRRFVHKGEMQWQPVDLNHPVREVAALLEHEVHASQAKLVLELDDPLPAVRADPLLLEQVIYNLARNALEAVADGRPAGEVILRTHADAGRVRLEVLDNGPGVDADLGARVFDPFVSQKPGGLGIGLAISRSIVHAHKGELGYGNREGGGAVFHLDLPAVSG